MKERRKKEKDDGVNMVWMMRGGDGAKRNNDSDGIDATYCSVGTIP